MRRKLENPPASEIPIKQKLRSKFPQRQRLAISPVLCSSPTSFSSSNLTRDVLREVSCLSSRLFAKDKTQKKTLKKRSLEEIVNEGEEFRRFTRSYCRKRQNDIETDKRGDEVELSESSCVESCAEEVVDVARVRELTWESRIGKGCGNAKENVDSNSKEAETVMNSEISSVQQMTTDFSGKIFNLDKYTEKRDQNLIQIDKNNVISLAPDVKSPREVEFRHLFGKSLKSSDNRGHEDEMPEVSHKCAESELESSVDQLEKLIGVDANLTCSENLPRDEASGYKSEFSDLDLEIFPECSSNFDFSEYTPSIWSDSGSQFSERSIDNASPSPMFQLFLQFGQQFCRSKVSLDSKVSPCSEIESIDEIRFLRWDEQEHEESYKMIRERERRQVYLHDYAEEYCSTTDYGDLVIQQRLYMVHWIIEKSNCMELQTETMFLGVSLLDRFLSKGYFKSKRNLQIAGIASLTLAIRIEENQAYNSVPQKAFFYVESNVYTRLEVVAMEWLVQKVLNFQCFLPTMYNFLWFYLKVARANKEVEKTSKNLAVLALHGHEQLCYWPSTLAAGLVILASMASNQNSSCLNVTEIHSRAKGNNLVKCIKSLEWLLKYINRK